MAEANIETQGAAQTGAQSADREDKPICLLMLGMAGSGKSTLVQVSFDEKSLMKPEYALFNNFFGNQLMFANRDSPPT